MRKLLATTLAVLLFLAGAALPVSAQAQPLAHTKLINEMTLEEKALLLCGASSSRTNAIPRLDIPTVTLSDGPHGVRGYGEAVCFPTASLSACSWDAGLLELMGGALGDAAIAADVDLILGPGLNIKRSPLCGRNFEYYSEDPWLSGMMAAAMTRGIQSRDVGACLKHFAVNNQETRRTTIDAVADERALREIYLPAFEMAVKQVQPWAVMSAYNRFEGVYLTENSRLQNDILRGEWGFGGMIVSDWGGVRDRAAAVRGGTDLEMPHSMGMGVKSIIEAVGTGTLSQAELDRSVERMLTLIDRAGSGEKQARLDIAQQDDLARKIAEESIVLLKNEGDVLPLNTSQKIAVIGEFAQNPRFQGEGSSMINTDKKSNALQALQDAWRDANPSGSQVEYAQGYTVWPRQGLTDPLLRTRAARLAARSDVAVVFVGIPSTSDAEGIDRTDMALPDSQNKLVEAVAKANPNTVVVYCGGSAVTMDWMDQVKGFICTYLAGQAGGTATANILLGLTNPSGKLAETWPLAQEDVPCAAYFPGYPKSAEYRESIFVGYRYYDTFNKPVRFPFGYGLSYTKFEYSGLKVDGDQVTFTVKNIGERAGAESAQLYIRPLQSTAFRPEKELKGFGKVYLEPGESKAITIELDERSFAFFNTRTNDWCIESGEYEILIAASSDDIRLRETVRKQGSAASDIPDARNTAPAYYGLNGFTPADVPDAQFIAVLGRALPPRDLPQGSVITSSDSMQDAILNNDAARAVYVHIFRPIMALVTALIPHAVYVDYIMQVSTFWLASMTGGAMDEDIMNSLLRLYNGDWKGLFEVAWGVLGNLV